MTAPIGHIIGWSLIVICIWLIVATLIDIHRVFGLGSTRGFCWALAVTLGSVFGVVLYRFFRQPTEHFCTALFRPQ